MKMVVVVRASVPARTWRILLGIFCIALLVLGATLQVSHIHGSGPVVHADCSLCLSAHGSIEAATTEDVTLTRIVSRTEAVDIQPELKFRFVAFSLWNRPPPEGLAHS